MGFLNLKSWKSAGGRVRAERGSTEVQYQPSRYYYSQLFEFQAVVDRNFEVTGNRPPSVDDLYLWTLAQDGASADDVRAADLADWMSYFDIEPNSLLGIINVAADHEPVARRLIGKRQLASRPVPGEVRARRRSFAGGQV